MNFTVHIYRNRAGYVCARFDFADGSQHCCKVPVRDTAYRRVIGHAFHALAVHVQGAAECVAKVREALGAMP